MKTLAIALLLLCVFLCTTCGDDKESYKQCWDEELFVHCSALLETEYEKVYTCGQCLTHVTCGSETGMNIANHCWGEE